MTRSDKLFSLIAIAGLASFLGAGAALAQIEQAHLRIDGMT